MVPEGGDATNGTVTPSVIGTATTDAGGNWSFSVPAYSSLPTDAQSLASANDGYLNLEAIALGTAIAGGSSYVETGVSVQSGWVGTATQTQPASQTAGAAPPVMTLRPDGPDTSAQNTPAAQAATSVSQINPEATDSSGNVIGDTSLADTTAPVDAYRYQEIGGARPFNPNTPAHGTNLTNVPLPAHAT